MANRLRIAPINFHDAATLSATSEATGYPITNTQNVRRSREWRATSTVSQVIQGAWAGKDRNVNCLFVLRHNLQGITIRLQTYSDAAWTTQVYDSTTLTIPSSGYSSAFNFGTDSIDALGQEPLFKEAPYALYFSSPTCKSYKITFGATSVAAHVGRIFLGKYVEATVNPAYGMTLGWEENNAQARTLGGSLQSSALGDRWRSLQFDLSWMQEAQRNTWLDIMALCGLRQDVMVAAFSGAGDRTERDYTLNGKFVGLEPIGMQVSTRTKRVTIKEV